MTNEEKELLSYRFSGYQLPMLQLDSTGSQYIYIPEPHPYYRVNPEWQKTQGSWPSDNVEIAPSLHPLGSQPPNLK